MFSQTGTSSRVVKPLTWLGHTVVAVELHVLDVGWERVLQNYQCEIIVFLINESLEIDQGQVFIRHFSIIARVDVYLANVFDSERVRMN